MTRQICDKAIINGVLGLVDCFGPIDRNLFDSSQKAEWPDQTNCWRNYRATWVIKDKRLYLTHIQGKRRLNVILPILADWFTGRITILSGEILDSTPLLQYAPITEIRTNLYVVSGYVFREHVHDVNKNRLVTLQTSEFIGPMIPRDVMLARFIDE